MRNWKRRLCLAWLVLLSLPGNAATPTVTAGNQFALALKSDGAVISWGNNDRGQLGNGQAALRSLPARVDGIDQVMAAAAGAAFTLALRADGALWGWGNNLSGQLGDGTRQSKAYPVRVTGISGTVTSVAAGFEHALAVTADGKLWAWGYGGYGALGTGDQGNRTSAVQVSGLPDVRAAAAGDNYSLALAADGTVWTWGDNAYGQLGNGTTTASLTPVRVNALSNIVAISALGWSNLALDTDNQVWAWGFGGWGALGDGTTNDRSTPFVVPGLPRIAAVAPGNRVSIAVASGDGSVWVWGDNGTGLFGDGRYTSQLSPVSVASLTGLANFSVGNQHVAARGPGNVVMSWGRNGYGQLGVGDTGDRAVPTVVSGLPPIVQLAAGFTYSVAVAGDGTVWAWGSNGSGELADGTVAVANVPADVQGLSDIAALAAGASHSLALGADGSVWGWGANNNYELGDSTRRDALTPKQITGLPAMTAVAAGYETSFALDRTGTVWSWGNNFTYGALGLGSLSGVALPAPITTLSGVSGISTSHEHALAVTSDGAVWSWGSNSDGQLGDGTTNDRSTPVRVNNLSNIRAVAAGVFHSLALDGSGNVWAWGYNYDGELGDGTTTDRLAPVRVSGLSNVLAISAGENYSCALGADGRLWSWGWNASGRLGAGSSQSWVPVAAPISDPGDFQSVSCGSASAAAMRADGTVWTWGRNFEGQLGDGTFAERSQPVLAVDQTLTGELDLIPQVANSIPPGRSPPFLARAIRSGDLSRFSLSVDVKGSTGTGAFAAASGRFAADYNVYVAASVAAGGTPAYFQLDSGYNWSALSWPIAEFIRGAALNTQNDVVRAQILQNVDLSQLAGAEIIIGYGADPDEMLRNARYRTVFTVPEQ